MSTVVDEISPLEYGEDRFDLELSTATPDPRAFNAVQITVNVDRCLPEGVKLPLEFTVTSQSQQATFHRQVFRSVVPTVLTFRPAEGGTMLFRLAELYHNKWWGAVVLDVEGDVLVRAPVTNPPATSEQPVAVFAAP